MASGDIKARRGVTQNCFCVIGSMRVAHLLLSELALVSLVHSTQQEHSLAQEIGKVSNIRAVQRLWRLYQSLQPLRSILQYVGDGSVRVVVLGCVRLRVATHEHARARRSCLWRVAHVGLCLLENVSNGAA